MAVSIEIDKFSGFCYGVVRAVKKAEEYLSNQDGSNQKASLFSLGSIVHNNPELERLKTQGLHIIGIEDVAALKDSTLLIRAHGEPPTTYRIAEQNNITIIDCTCPVVLKLQEKIRKAYANLLKTNGTLIIFGKAGHAEVNGLIGQADGEAVIVERLEDINKYIADGTINLLKPIAIFSQTTKDPIQYTEICETLQMCIEEAEGDIDNLKIYNTICGQVSSRHPNLTSFAKKHTILIFISGKESSNGKVLYKLCKSVNPNSFHIERKEEIDITRIKDGDSVGICGATSTPKWQLTDAAAYIKQLTEKW